MIKSKIDLIEKESFETFSLFTPLEFLLDSLIIKDWNTRYLFFDMLPEGTKLQLIFRGSRDGFKIAPFHQKVDN